MLTDKAVPYVAFLIGPSGKITTWNAACQKVLGYAEADILLRPITKLLAPQDKKLCEERLKASRVEAERLETEIVHANGMSSTLSLIFVPQFRKSGRFSGYSVIVGPAGDAHGARLQLSERELIGQTPLRNMLNLLAGTFYVINTSGHIVMWNKRVEQATQLTPAELGKIHALDLFLPEEQALVGQKINAVFERDEEVQVEANLLSRNGSTTPYLFTGLRFESDGQFYLCGMGLDISERRKQEERLRLRERALHASSNGILITRCVGRKHPIEYVNPAFERITGYSAQELLGVDSQFMSGFMAASGLDESERALLRAAIHDRREFNVVFRNLRKNGELFWCDLTVTPVMNEHNVATHFIGVMNDVTATKQRTSHLEHAVNHDELTGLANRNLLMDRLELALHVAQRNKTLVATVLVDLDNFKAINDSMGHDAGDEVLKVAARKLQASVRDSDTVARLGGDEFVLVLSDQPSLRHALRMIDRLRADMAQPVVIESKEIVIESSMGVSVFPHDGASASELIRAADVAMYHAKAGGRNDVHFFSPDMKSTTEAKHKLELGMRAAIERDEMFLMFQPKVCLRTGHIVGAEAFLRWRHPERGILPAAAFIADAEENGLIVPLGELVLSSICRVVQLKQGLENLVISMNVSFQELSQKNYVALLSEKLSHEHLAPASFELEIKEADLMRSPQLTREVLGKINQAGIKVTIDEFGAGALSLNVLQKLPVSRLKISKRFVDSIAAGQSDGIMAKTVIEIGHIMHVDVIGECVETSSQFEFLKQNGCDQIQGNFFSEPIELAGFEQLLKQARS
jgi:diguanylate cyclase (GGDEF)-like protein/PAS domain S-box-containing protein